MMSNSKNKICMKIKTNCFFLSSDIFLDSWSFSKQDLVNSVVKRSLFINFSMTFRANLRILTKLTLLLNPKSNTFPLHDISYLFGMEYLLNNGFYWSCTLMFIEKFNNQLCRYFL